MKKVFLIFLVLGLFSVKVFSQEAAAYILKSNGDSVSIVYQSFGIDDHGIYFKDAVKKRLTYIKDEDIKKAVDDGRTFQYIIGSFDGKGFSKFAEIKAINEKYMLAILRNFSDIYDIYILDKETGNWKEQSIKTESTQKRETAKQLILKYFSDCKQLSDLINKDKRFPSYEFQISKQIICPY